MPIQPISLLRRAGVACILTFHQYKWHAVGVCVAGVLGAAAWYWPQLPFSAGKAEETAQSPIPLETLSADLGLLREDIQGMGAQLHAQEEQLAVAKEAVTTFNEAVTTSLSELSDQVSKVTRTVATPKAVGGKSPATVKEEDPLIEEEPGNGLINLNTATAAELDELPGIGLTYAERIIEYRKENGAFTSIDDLANVKGIGDAILEKIRDLVDV